MNSLGKRLRAIAEHETSATRRFKELELATSIPSKTWLTFVGRSARPSSDMVEAVAQRWPQYAFWLATGITDPVFGHVAPPLSVKRPMIRGVEQEAATQEFRYLIEHLKTGPTDDAEAQTRAQELEDAGLEAMKRFVTPAAHVSYEKAMRGLGESGHTTCIYWRSIATTLRSAVQGSTRSCSHSNGKRGDGSETFRRPTKSTSIFHGL
ncbi:MAG: hypothetical protein CBARDCOR_4688 [uncultured Caballeronia sp.]|nr:MAG: hypothetical protein CBARDCOR_4688 [uncultured Caballeronia sp.]